MSVPRWLLLALPVLTSATVVAGAQAQAVCPPDQLQNPASPEYCIPGPPDDDDPPDDGPAGPGAEPDPDPPNGGGSVPRPRRLTLLVRPRRDRQAPTRYRARGRIIRPSELTGNTGCRGRVRITVKRNDRRVARRTLRVRRSCRYGSRIAVRSGRLGRRGRLTVRARFTGNNRLAPRSSPRVTVRYRR